MNQLAMETHGHMPNFAAEDFIRSESNQMAYDVLMQWPDWPAPLLSLVGPPSCGKTHLASIWALHADAVIIDQDMLGNVPSEDIIGSAKAALLDEVDERVHEEGLFHLINYCRAHTISLLLVSRKNLSSLTFATADVRSRLTVIPHIAITPPDDALFTSLIYKYFSDRQLRVSMDVVEFIVKRIERSCFAAQNAVSDIDRKALEKKRNITVPFIKKCMGWEI